MPRKAKGQGKKKRASTRASRPKQTTSLTQMVKGPMYTMGASPISYFTNATDSTSASVGKAPSWEGIAGVRIVGNQPMAQVTGVLASTSCFDSTVSLAYVNPNTIPLNPVSMRGRLATMAGSYERYVFRKLRFRWVTQVPQNTESGLWAYCVQADANIDTDTPQSFQEVRQVTPSVALPGFAPNAILEYDYRGKDLWYVSNTATDSVAANIRQKWQGLFVGYPNGAYSYSSRDLGYWDVSYVIDLYYPTFTQTLTLSTVPGVAQAALLLEEIDRKERKKKASIEDPHAKAVKAVMDKATLLCPELGTAEWKEKEKRSSLEACEGSEPDIEVVAASKDASSESGSASALPQLLKLLQQLTSK